MTSIMINCAGDHQYTPEALDRVAMLIEDVLRGREPLRIDGLSAHTGKPASMIRAAVARGIAAGDARSSGCAITPPAGRGGSARRSRRRRP